MKVLIIYATKYGTTKKAAEMIASKISFEKEIYNINNLPNIDLTKYDKIIFGSSVKAGALDRKIRKFCNQNISIFEKKNTSLFIVGVEESNLSQVLSMNFSPELLKAFNNIQFVGGEINKENAKGFGKLVFKLITASYEKENKPLPGLMEERINELVKKINMN